MPGCLRHGDADRIEGNYANSDRSLGKQYARTLEDISFISIFMGLKVLKHAPRGTKKMNRAGPPRPIPTNILTSISLSRQVFMNNFAYITSFNSHFEQLSRQKLFMRTCRWKVIRFFKSQPYSFFCPSPACQGLEHGGYVH